MHWTYTPYALPLLVSAAVSAWMSLYAMRRRPKVSYATAFGLLALAGAIWALAYGLELLGADLPTKLFWAKMQYLGIPTIFPLLLIFVLHYMGRTRWLAPRRTVLLMVIPVITTLLALTNEAHSLIWSSITLETRGGTLLLSLRHGAWFWIFVAYGSLVIIATVVLMVKAYLESLSPHRQQLGLMLVGVVIPTIANILYLLDVSPAPGLDLTPFAFILSFGLVAFGVFRFSLLSFAPVEAGTPPSGQGDLIIVLDPRNGIQHLNRAAERVLGKRSAQAVGQPIDSLIPRWAEIMERLQDGTTTEMETLLGESGNQRRYALSVVPDPTQPAPPAGRLVIFRDVTERALTVQALRQSEAMFRTLAETMPSAIMIYQGEHFRYLNPAAEALTGYSRAQMDTLRFWDIVHPEFRELVRERGFARQQDKDVPQRYQFKIITRSGEERWVDFAAARIEFEGKPAGMGTAYDITESKRSEEALERRNTYLAALHDTALVVMARLNLEDSLETIVNKATDLMDAAYGWVYLVDPENDEIEAKVGAGLYRRFIGHRMQRGEGLAGKVWQTGEPLIVENYAIWDGRSMYYEQHPAGAAMGVPLKSDTEVVGVLGVARLESAPAFTKEEINQFSLFAQLASIALDNARLYGSAQQELVERTRAEEALRRREAILEAVAFAAQRFLQTTSWEEEILAVLARLGQATDASRVYIFENHLDSDGAPVASQKYEWSAQGIETQIHNLALQNIPRKGGSFARWDEELSRGHIITANARDTSGPERDALEAQGIVSILAVPVFVGSAWWGFVGFDECRAERAWSDVEVDALKAAAGTLGAAIQNQKARRAQAVLFQISQAAASAASVEELVGEIHRQVGTLIDVTNFYVALYDEKTGSYSFPFYIDQYDSVHEHSPQQLSRSLTDYVRRTGQPLFVNDQVHQLLTEAGEVELVGTPSPIWMGVPLKTARGVIGVVVVQSYHQKSLYAPQDLELMTFVADNIAAAIERKHAEEAIRQSEEKFRTVFQTSTDAIVLSDLNDGTYVDLNEGYLQLSGYSREELIGKSALSLGTWADAGERAKLVQRLKETGPVSGFEIKVRQKNGSIRTVLISAQVVEIGGVSRMLSTNRDITEYKQLQEQLRQSQKMEAIGTLAGGVAHDFNNLLTAILGNAAFLMESLDNDDERMEEVREIQKAGERAVALTSQLLAFSRRQMVEPKILNLNVIITDVSRMLQRLLGEDIELHLSLDGNLAPVRADPGHMSQVLVNLAANARDAMPGGGRLTIETANAVLDQAFRDLHPEVSPGRYVLLVVSDTGVGIAPDVRERIFEPFFTTKEVGRGTGLGLSVVYGIVRQGDGHIFVDSRIGYGTRFEIYLPMAEGGAEERSEESAAVLARGEETILLAEDEDIVREVAARILKDQGYTVLEATSGDDALGICAEHLGEVHLLLTDVIMPQMSGEELARRARAIRPDMRVLYTSGYSSAVMRQQIPESRGIFLQKPFTARDLLRTVRLILDQ